VLVVVARGRSHLRGDDGLIEEGEVPVNEINGRESYESMTSAEVLIVSSTNEAICGHIRGFRVEQMMTSIESDVSVAMIRKRLIKNYSIGSYYKIKFRRTDGFGAFHCEVIERGSVIVQTGKECETGLKDGWESINLYRGYDHFCLLGFSSSLLGGDR
jgi:hypothetical protein